MRTLFYLSESQLERIKPFFPRSHGAPRVDDRRVVSGIIYAVQSIHQVEQTRWFQ